MFPLPQLMEKAAKKRAGKPEPPSQFFTQCSDTLSRKVIGKAERHDFSRKLQMNTKAGSSAISV